MSKIIWALRITIASSAKQRAEEIAVTECRSATNYIRSLIEKDIREKETRPHEV